MLSSMEADRIRLSDLDTRIRDIERSLFALRTERSQVKERLDAYKYPVLTLPNELTSEFFIHFLPIYPAAPPLTGLASPTTLTHVCRKWREIALATPALWRAIRLHYEYDHETNIPKRFNQMNISDAWIRRSKSCPLSMYINIRHPDIMRKIFTETFIMATARWEHVILLEGDTPFLFLNTGRPMPLLRSLRLWLQVTNNVFTFPDVPQLCTVHLTGVIAGLNVTLPWAQLTRLTLFYLGINRCISILRQTTKLVQCSLTMSSSQSESVDFLGSDLALPHLEVLSLETMTQPVDGVGFLSSFIVPSLHTLELKEIFLGAEPIPALEMFVARSGCRLQQLGIIASWDEEVHIERYRLAFPSISIFHRY
ncbi:F-box domain-containing protein [Mycena sanguinolenta]|uniref:F-box domain-containing protein n=1 Tax=Mycena sanguinolenta TaxID=230812 RepID=A0A8H6ZD31_9AGAR|nr:F-box domain-containing protein [Mycena sanguinolenta]